VKISTEHKSSLLLRLLIINNRQLQQYRVTEIKHATQCQVDTLADIKSQKVTQQLLGDFLTSYIDDQQCWIAHTVTFIRGFTVIW